MNKILLLLIFAFTISSAFSQKKSIWFYNNEGQWNEKVLFKTPLSIGDFYIDKEGFTYHLIEKNPLAHEDDHTQKRISKTIKSENELIGIDAISTKFIGANFSKSSHSITSKHYHNYFLGTDTSKWKGNIFGYKKVEFSNFYPNVSMIVESTDESIEYSFILNGSQDPSIIQMKIEGDQNSYLDESGNLLIRSRFGSIINKKPKAWTIDPLTGTKKDVSIAFELKNSIVSYAIKEKYDKNHLLVIDPEIIFSSFTGSLTDNRGFTATPDMNGNLIAGGVTFGMGYPTKSGAYNINFNGGDSVYVDSSNNVFTLNHSAIDLTISKFNSNGTDLLFSTYIGGKGNETPHSMICNKNNDLYIFGATSSSDFPMTSNAYDKTFNGGKLSVKQLTMFFPKTDIYVLKLSENGSNLKASTYIGGSDNDGISDSTLCYNSGDEFRGEIYINPKDNDVLIASSTQSKDFPLLHSFQNQLKGYQDAVIFKFSEGLDKLVWSSYFGGNGVETGNAVQSSLDGTIYVTGGTTSTELTFTNGNQTSYNGGLSDGYLLKLVGDKPTINTSTAIGSTAYDQSYFVQLDKDNNVFVYGQSEGLFSITPGKYGVANSGQFIRKYDSNLKTVIWNTNFGTGSGFVDISPTAFSVSSCGDIYISGWGGFKNRMTSKAKNSTTVGLSITNDAFQAVTNGNNFYVAVLGNDASTLSYATFMGGLSASNNHVDGGTSRFDKRGGIYQAVCTGCGGITDGFSTTPGVFSPTNNVIDRGCNLAAFEFDLKSSLAKVTTTDSSGCINGDIHFTNLSVNCDTYYWDFGDGTNSTELNPIHKYKNAGKYFVKLIASDSKSDCLVPDTSVTEINIYNNNETIINPITTTCIGSEVLISTIEGGIYTWKPTELFQSETGSTLKTIITKDIDIEVHVEKGCRTLDITFPYRILTLNQESAKSYHVCSGSSITLNITGGNNITWSPATYLNTTTGGSVVSTPKDSITYIVSTDINGTCKQMDTIYIKIIDNNKKLEIDSVMTLCLNEAKIINVNEYESLTFNPSVGIKQINKNQYEIKPPTSVNYQFIYSNSCTTNNGQLSVKLLTPNMSVTKDTNVCIDDSARIECFGGIKYRWLNLDNVSYLSQNKSIANVSPKIKTTYHIECIDSNNCIDTVAVTIGIYNKPVIETQTLYAANWGKYITLNPSVNPSFQGKFSWKPEFKCENCSFIEFLPEKDLDLTVFFVDTNQCRDSVNIFIRMQSDIYIPNTFTPNSDNHNDRFKAEGNNITDFSMDIYDRWGELIIHLSHFDEYWDGSYHGKKSPIGTYTWEASYTDSFGERKLKRGHVSLIR